MNFQPQRAQEPDSLGHNQTLMLPNPWASPLIYPASQAPLFIQLHNVIITIIILTSTLSYRPNKQNMGSTHNSVLLVEGIQMMLASNSRPSEAQWSTKHLG